MNPETSTDSDAPASRLARRNQTDSLVATLSAEFPGFTACEIRVAVLQAEDNLWPKKDNFVLLDHARDLLRRGSA